MKKTLFNIGKLVYCGVHRPAEYQECDLCGGDYLWGPALMERIKAYNQHYDTFYAFNTDDPVCPKCHGKRSFLHRAEEKFILTGKIVKIIRRGSKFYYVLRIDIGNNECSDAEFEENKLFVSLDEAKKWLIKRERKTK